MSSELREIWTNAGGRAPDHWSFVRFEDLLAGPKAIAVGVMYPGSHDESGVPLIKVSDVKNGAVVDKPGFRISEVVNDEYRRTSLIGNEILITLVGKPGDCAIVDESMAGWNAARALAVVRLRDPTLRPWLRYVLLSSTAKHLIDARLNTTVQKTLNLKDIRSLPIPMASQAERNAIVETAAALEKKINVNHQVNQTLEQMAQAIFKSWFVDFEPVKAKIAARERWQARQSAQQPASPVCYAAELESEDPELETRMTLTAMQAISGKTEAQLTRLQTEHPDHYAELRATADLFPSAMKESELGEIPAGWRVAPMERLCNVRKGLSYKGKHVTDDPNELPLLNLGNFAGWGAFRFEKTKYYDGSYKDRHLVSVGQLMVANTDMTQNRVILGSPLIAPSFNHSRVLFTHHVFAVDFKHEYPEPLWKHFIFHWCLQPSFRARAEGFATGTTVLALPKDAFLNCSIVVAPADVVDAFNDIAEDTFKHRAELTAQNMSLERLRDTLLPKLLSGEIPVPQAESTVTEAAGA